MRLFLVGLAIGALAGWGGTFMWCMAHTSPSIVQPPVTERIVEKETVVQAVPKVVAPAVERSSVQVAVPADHSGQSAAVQKAQATNPMLEGQIPGYPKLEPKVRALIDQSRVLADSNKPEDAIRLLQTAHDENPQEEYVAIELAFAYGEYVQDAAKAEAVLRAINKEKGDSRMAASALGDFLTKQGRHAEATESLRRAALGDARPEAQAKLGRNLFALGDAKGAAENMERAHQGYLAEEESLAREGESTRFTARSRASAALELAFLNLQLGKVEAAQQLYGEILKVRGKDDAGVLSLQRELTRQMSGQQSE